MADVINVQKNNKRGRGRPVGSMSKKSQEIATRAAEQGITPLEYMLNVMRDDMAEPERRDRMASSAAPYMHPKLNAIEHTGKDGGAIQGTIKLEIIGVNPARGTAV
jgi:hypothetical protein